MAEDGLVIPKETSLNTVMEDLRSTIEELGGKLPDKKETTEFQNKSEEYYAKQEEFQRDVKNDPVYQYLKRIFPERYQKKLNKIYEKSLIKNKYFQFSMKALASIDEAVNNNAGWIVSLLTLLGALAIFDPNGSFITMVINQIADGIIWVADLILPMIPQIISTMFKLIPIIVNKLADIIPRLLQGIGNALFKAGENAGGFFGAMLKFISFLVSNDVIITLLQSFVKTLQYIVPTLLIIAGLAKGIIFITSIVTKLIPVFQALGAVVSFLLSPIGLFIAGAVAIGVAIYFLAKNWERITKATNKFSNYISDFFTESLPSFFMKGVEYIWGLADQFDKWLEDFGKNLRKKFANLGYKLSRTFSNYILTPFLEGWSKFKNFMKDLWTAIKSPFVRLKDFLQGLFLYISSFVKNPFKSLSFNQAQAISTLSSQTGISQGRLEEITKSKGRIQLTKDEIAEAQAKNANFDQVELMKQLAALKAGDDEKLAKIMQSIDNKMTPEMGGTPELKGSVE